MIVPGEKAINLPYNQLLMKYLFDPVTHMANVAPFQRPLADSKILLPSGYTFVLLHIQYQQAF